MIGGISGLMASGFQSPKLSPLDRAPSPPKKERDIRSGHGLCSWRARGDAEIDGVEDADTRARRERLVQKTGAMGVFGNYHLRRAVVAQ
jgi:hypothetical protein